MTKLTIEREDPPDTTITDAERITREGTADFVIIKFAVDGNWVIEIEGRTDDLSQSEFDSFVDRIHEVVDGSHNKLDTFYGRGQYDKSYLIRMWY